MATMTMTTTRSGAPALDEDTEEELANQLLNVQSEEELEYFLGDFLKKAVGTIGKVGGALLPALKTVAKVGLPIAAKAVGTMFGGPAGGAVGGQLGSMISNAIKEAEADVEEAFGEMEEGDREEFLGDIIGGILGGEMEAASPAERQLDAAKRFVRVAATAARKLAAQPTAANPTAAAISALQSATKKLTSATQKSTGGGFFAPAAQQQHMSGRWHRRGNQIVIYGV